jgi:V8-like Glu-specific endopeptidase
MINMKFISLAFLAMLSTQANALPLGSFNALKVAPNSFKALDPNYDFDGIVKLSDCSGSIIRFAGMPDAAKAVAMTNGHCLSSGMPDPGQVVSNQAVNRNMKVFNHSQKLVSITAVKVLYSSMTNSDITLYELKDTYKDLMNKGVDSFDLAGTHPGLGTSMDIVSGYWDRGYRCNIDAFIYELKEAGWTMKDSIRYSATGCDTIGGTSGSPIIQTGTRTVIGINNTGNEDGQKCTMDNPCEVDEQGNIVVRKGASYGQQTYRITTCLTPDFRIDLTLPNCELYKQTR